MENIWTDERIERLKELWAGGLSCAQIAVEMKCFSHYDDAGRNAVVGKVHRMKLPQPLGKKVYSRNKRQRQAPRPRGDNDLPLRNQIIGGRPRPPPRRRTSSHYDILANIAIAASEPGIPEQLKGEEPDGSGIKHSELTDFTCRWPRGDPKEPNFEFCGRRAIEGLPYCGPHCRLAYVPAQSRTRADKALS